MFKHFYFLTLLILAVGVSCKAIQKKSTYLGFLNLSLLSIFLFGCNKLNKIDKNLKKLQEGKYNLECVIHNSNSNETDTIIRICIGPEIGDDTFGFFLYQTITDDFYVLSVSDIKNEKIFGFTHRIPSQSLSTPNCNYVIEENSLKIHFENDSLNGDVILNRIP
jgi:maltodextrin utilization protein YvdJ